MDEDSILELLDLYQDMVEKQDEVIYRLGKIVARQAADLKLMKDNEEFSDEKLKSEMDVTEEVMGQYKDLRSGLEP